MNPILYGASEQDFSTLGLGVLNDAISCKVHTVLNGMFELEMQYPVTGKRYGDIAISCIIKAVAEKGGTPQLFDIYAITKPISGIVTIYASHVSNRKQFIPITPCSAANIGAAFTAISGASAENNPFTLWTDKTTVANFNLKVPASLGNVLGGMAGSILDVYGGEYEFDNFTIKLWNHRGQDNGVTLRYGKNITDIEQEESIANTITGICPFWADLNGDNVVTLPEGTVDSASASNFPFKRTITKDFSMSFEEQPTVAELRAKAQSYVQRSGIGVPAVGIDLSYENLADYEEYQDVALFEQVKLGDTVKVYFEPLDITATARVTETDYNVLLDKYNKIRIGSVKASLSTVINDDAVEAQEIAETTAAKTTSALEAAFADALEKLSGADGGYVVINRNPVTGQPYEILIMDSDDASLAQNVLRLNMNGLGLSTNGINGPYTAAITGAGITADAIITGSLIASNGQYSLDMSTGTVNMANANITGGNINIETASETEDKITLWYTWTYEGSKFVQKTTISPKTIEVSKSTYDAFTDAFRGSEVATITPLAVQSVSRNSNNVIDGYSSIGHTTGIGTNTRVSISYSNGEIAIADKGVVFRNSASKVMRFVPSPKSVASSGTNATGYLRLGRFYLTGANADAPIKFHITGRSTDIECILEFSNASTVMNTQISKFWAYGRFPTTAAVPYVSSGVYVSDSNSKYFEIYMPVSMAIYVAEIDSVQMSQHMATRIQDITTISDDVTYNSGTPSGMAATVQYRLT